MPWNYERIVAELRAAQRERDYLRLGASLLTENQMFGILPDLVEIERKIEDLQEQLDLC